MAIFIEACFSKKIGLPQFSSAGYSVTLRTEVSDLNGVEKESAQLYELLKNCVDRELQDVGHVPVPISSSQSIAPRTIQDESWACSDKQRELILKIVDEHRLDKHEIERLSKELFQKPVKTLNKLEASGMIEELLKQHGPTNGNGGRQYQRGGRR